MTALLKTMTTLQQPNPSTVTRWKRRRQRRWWRRRRRKKTMRSLEHAAVLRSGREMRYCSRICS
jgi:hypothetical protein